jgi:hypothetical protein
VNILIEDGHRHSAQALEVMKDLKKAGQSDSWLHVLSVGLASKKGHPILQAADVGPCGMAKHSRRQSGDI